jgi:Ca2+-binding EF-hand superfamily protein
MGHKVMPREVAAIVRRLDIDGDSQIGYSEFVESMSPVSPDMIPPKTIKSS